MRVGADIDGIVNEMGVRHAIVAVIGEFEHKAMAVAELPGAGSSFWVVGNRRIVNDGAAIAIACEAEVRRLIGAVKLQGRMDPFDEKDP
jgi:hypothetical protein